MQVFVWVLFTIAGLFTPFFERMMKQFMLLVLLSAIGYAGLAQSTCDTVTISGYESHLNFFSKKPDPNELMPADYILAVKIYNTVSLYHTDDSLFISIKPKLLEFCSYFETQVEPFLKTKYGYSYAQGFSIRIKELDIVIRGHDCRSRFHIVEYQSPYKGITYRG